MSNLFVLCKHVPFSNNFLRSKFLPRVLISSKSFCSKDNGPNGDHKKSDGSETKTAEKLSKKAPEKTKEICELNAKVPNDTKEAAEKKITNLLSEIQEVSDAPVKTPSKLNLAKPLKRITKKERLEILKANESTPESEINVAVKEVASSFKDAEKVEAELSEKLGALNLSKERTKENVVNNESKFDTSVSESLISSVEEVAETISDSPIPSRTELTEKLLKVSREKQSVPKKQRPMYFKNEPLPRHRYHRDGRMSVMAQLRLEADFAAAAKKASEKNKPTPKYYSDDSGPRYHSRRNVEMSVIERMRLEAKFGVSAEKNSYEQQKKSASRQYKDQSEQSHHDSRSDNRQYKDWPEQSYSDERSVIGKMRREAQLAALNKKYSAEEKQPVSRQYKDWTESRRRVYRSDDQSVIGQMEKEAQLAALKREYSAEENKTMSRPQISKIGLFGSTPLNIFSLDTETKTESRNMFWQKLEEKQLSLLSQFAPANGFEEMILWTEQGKHWKFPIDNQTEMGAEENIGFNEHVFLEQHLKGFPTRGPIRHFMELVVVGLSKNPYITVQRKIDNIEWFRDYFKEKEDILKETGALE